MSQGGFKTGVTYLGGHPDSVVPCAGRLTLDGASLQFKPLGFSVLSAFSKDKPTPFSVDVADVGAVEFLGPNDLKDVPRGYWQPIPGFALEMDWLQQKKYKQLLTVRVRGQGGSELVIAFANPPMGSFDTGTLSRGLGGLTPHRTGQILANKIVAAREHARATRDGT